MRRTQELIERDADAARAGAKIARLRSHGHAELPPLRIERKRSAAHDRSVAWQPTDNRRAP
jgi:hypothetical protein